MEEESIKTIPTTRFRNRFLSLASTYAFPAKNAIGLELPPAEVN